MDPYHYSMLGRAAPGVPSSSRQVGIASSTAPQTCQPSNNMVHLRDNGAPTMPFATPIVGYHPGPCAAPNPQYSWGHSAMMPFHPQPPPMAMTTLPLPLPAPSRGMLETSTEHRLHHHPHRHCAQATIASYPIQHHTTGTEQTQVRSTASSDDASSTLCASTHMHQPESTTQQFKRPLSYMFFTPAGAACTICSMGFAVERWRHHFEVHHSYLSFRKVEKGFCSKLVTYINEARFNPDRLQYAESAQVYTKPSCSSCGTIFTEKRNLTKHLKKEKCSSGEPIMMSCYKLKCGRFYPVQGTVGSDGDEELGLSLQHHSALVDTYTQVTDAAYSKAGGSIIDKTISTLVPGGSTVSSIGHTPSPPASEREFFRSIFRNQQMAPSNMDATYIVEDVLKKVIDKHDTVTEWCKIFHQRIASDRNFLVNVKKDVEAMADVSTVITKERILLKLSDAFKKLEANLSGVVASARGDEMAALVKFRAEEDGDAENPARWGFRVRAGSTKQVKEFDALICYLHFHGCDILKEYTQQLADPSYQAVDAHRDGLVSMLLFDLATEPLKEGEQDYIPWLLRFAQSRCFKLQNGSVALRSIAQCGKLFATILYMIREGALTAGSLMDRDHADKKKQMLILVTKRPATQMISRWICACRRKRNNEEEKQNSHTNDQADIICGNAIFKREIWTNLIPLVYASLINLFSVAFAGDNWRFFLKPGCFQVSQKYGIAAAFSNGHSHHPYRKHVHVLHQYGNDPFNCDIAATTPDGTLQQLMSLKAADEYGLHSVTHQKITSLIELIFHGLGGGGERHTSIKKLYAKQLRFEAPTHSIYYRLRHDKSPSVRTTDGRGARHKVPRSLVPLFFLYRRLCLACPGHAQSSDVIVPIVRRKHFMKDAVAEIFGLDPKTFSDLNIRHLWAGLTNVIFDRNKDNAGKLVATNDAARMCNHKEKVHEEFYATYHVGRHESMYATYHRRLGEPELGSDMPPTARPRTTQESQLAALRFIFDDSATFLTREQAEMVDTCCNDTMHHNLINLGCGGGKGLSILVPVMVDFLHRWISGCRIFVVPYGFLLESLRESFSDRLSRTGGNIDIQAYYQRDIPADSREELPPGLLDIASPPQILLLTMDAAANLVTYHHWLLDAWVETSNLQAIYFDEIHTLFGEYGFRNKYQAIPNYARFGVPISVLTGSFHPELSVPLLSYLGLISVEDEGTGRSTSNPEQLFNHIQSPDVIGGGFNFIVARADGNIAIANLIERTLKAKPGCQIHALCKDKRRAIDIAAVLDQMKLPCRVVCVYSGMEGGHSSQASIAKQWHQGHIDVLVSTTVALVGNENSRCTEVMVIDYIYNLSSLIQAIGRLRANQRGPNSNVTQVVFNHHAKDHEFHQCQSDQLMKQLLDAGVSTQNQQSKLKELFHYDGYLGFLQEGGCYMKRLGAACGSIINECNRCTQCVHREQSVHIDTLMPLPIQSIPTSGDAPGPDNITAAASSTNGIDASSASVLPARARMERQNLPNPFVRQETSVAITGHVPHALPKPSHPIGAPLPATKTSGESVLTVRAGMKRPNPYCKGGGNPVATTWHTKSAVPNHPSPIQAAAVKSKERYEASIQSKNTADSVWRELGEKCWCCKTNDCEGDEIRCLNWGCYICGQPGHQSTKCEYRTNVPKQTFTKGKELDAWLKQQKICVTCLCPFDGKDNHGRDKVTHNFRCYAKKRLKRVLQAECRRQKSDYGDFVRKVHASKESYHQFLTNLTSPEVRL